MNRSTNCLRWLAASPALALWLVVSPAARADVKLPAIISDHMVVQADASVPIWGWSDAGENVSVSLAGQTQTVLANVAGDWTVTLTGLKSGGPYTLSVKGDDNQINVKDVLVGEVWLGSGQSNMAMTVASSMNFEEEKSAANKPTLRMFTVEKNPQPKPQADCKGSWVICTPDTVGPFSAALYFMGRDLQQQLNVPMGLINSSYGGTPIEAWISVEAQSKLSDYAQIADPWKKMESAPWDQAKADAQFDKQMAKWKEDVKKAKEEGTPPPRGPRKGVEPLYSQNRPGNLFNGMIYPILPYAVHGAIWYQGESNSAKEYASLYGEQLKTLIEDWRKRFGKEFPFAWVQLPDFREPQKTPNDPSSWAIIREQMLKTLSVPKTGMAVALGLGEEKDIHPKNKQGVGNRLAQWALVDVYGRPGVGESPLPAKFEFSGNQATIAFTNVGTGLKAKDGKVAGFAIAGDDKNFVWGDARIEGDKVVVSSPQVAKPVAVRYAWADNPEWSLENSAGLPASPFRTDDWK